jgi:hypothetical protein
VQQGGRPLLGPLAPHVVAGRVSMLACRTSWCAAERPALASSRSQMKVRLMSWGARPLVFISLPSLRRMS